MLLTEQRGLDGLFGEANNSARRKHLGAREPRAALRLRFANQQRLSRANTPDPQYPFRSLRSFTAVSVPFFSRRLRSVMRAHPAPVRMHRPTRPSLLALAFDYGCSTLLFVLLRGAGCGARAHGLALPAGGPNRTINCPRSPHQPVAGPNRQPSKACRVVSRKMALMTVPSRAHLSSAAAWYPMQTWSGFP